MNLISNVNKYINLHLFFIQDGEIIQLFSVADFVQTGNWKDYLMVFQCCYKWCDIHCKKAVVSGKAES